MKTGEWGGGVVLDEWTLRTPLLSRARALSLPERRGRVTHARARGGQRGWDPAGRCQRGAPTDFPPPRVAAWLTCGWASSQCDTTGAMPMDDSSLLTIVCELLAEAMSRTSRVSRVLMGRC